MKILLTTFLLTIILLIDCKAQSDTLVINLKNNQVEKIAVSQIQKIQFENITAVEEQGNGSSALVAKGNHPNPFTEQTSIEFEIGSMGLVVVYIYDNNGNQIQKLECTDCQAGNNSIQWNCLDNNNNRVQSGVYFYEVHFGSEVLAKKMIVVK